ncbi:hypothetical protein Hanom_Chr12g01159631 [Helianthus anomalus]
MKGGGGGGGVIIARKQGHNGGRYMANTGCRLLVIVIGQRLEKWGCWVVNERDRVRVVEMRLMSFFKF